MFDWPINSQTSGREAGVRTPIAQAVTRAANAMAMTGTRTGSADIAGLDHRIELARVASLFARTEA